MTAVYLAVQPSPSPPLKKAYSVQITAGSTLTTAGAIIHLRHLPALPLPLPLLFQLLLLMPRPTG